MNSRHLKRLAVDLHFFIEQANGTLTLVEDVDTLQPLGAFWKILTRPTAGAALETL